MSKIKVIDLTLLKALVASVEEQINAIDTDVTSKEDKMNAFVELTKVSGTMAHVLNETSVLMKETTLAMSFMSAPEANAAPKVPDFTTLFSSLPKTPGKN